MLEVDEEQPDSTAEGANDLLNGDSGGENASIEGPLDNPELSTNVAEPSADTEFEPAMPDELPVDTQWEDILPSSAPPAAADSGSDDFDFDDRNRGSESLQVVLQ